VDLNRNPELAQQLRDRGEVEAADQIDRLELQCFRLENRVTMLRGLLEMYAKDRNKR